MTVRLSRDWDRTLIRLTVYSFAGITDVILSAVLFVCAVRLAEMTGSSMATGGLFAIWAGVYLVSSLGAGQVVNRRNVGWILVASCTATALLALSYVRWPGMRAMYVIIAIQGVATAFFFTPFQVFMKLVDEGQNKGVARSSGLYVFSWSSGFALGPFIAGFLWAYGWQVCHLFNAAASAMMAIGIFLLKHHAEAPPGGQTSCPPSEDIGGRASCPPLDGSGGRTSCPPSDDTGPIPLPAAPPTQSPQELTCCASGEQGGRATRPSEKAAGSLPDLAWMAWVFGGLGCMIATMIRSHFPVSAEAFSLSKPSQGTMFLLLSGTQAIVGFLLGWSRTWMYRPWPVIGFGLFGVLGMVLFAVGRDVALFWTAAVCFGVYAGSFYFYYVYHALVHPTRAARYVSINEAVVGVMGIAGPAMGGMLADRFGLPVPYAVSAGLVLVGITVQAWLHHIKGGGHPARL